MSDLYLRCAPPPTASQAIAEDPGLVRPGSRKLTEIGWFIADACRDHVLWLERGRRRLPFADELPRLATEASDRRSVGSGDRQRWRDQPSFVDAARFARKF
ncbi:MAG: hypothetical protein ACK4TG_08570 [Thermaurantiacus sp.]